MNQSDNRLTEQMAVPISVFQTSAAFQISFWIIICMRAICLALRQAVR